MRLGALAAVALLVGCGRHWDLDQPFAQLSVDSAEIPAEPARAAFAAALQQLGGRVLSGAEQRVRVRFDPDCSCRGCTQYTVAHTEQPSQDTINICARWRLEPPDGLADAITHELGHVLGQWGHLQCIDTVMSPNYDCRKTAHVVYTPQDKTWICAGGVSGKLCE